MNNMAPWFHHNVLLNGIILLVQTFFEVQADLPHRNFYCQFGSLLVQLSIWASKATFTELGLEDVLKFPVSFRVYVKCINILVDFWRNIFITKITMLSFHKNVLSDLFLKVKYDYYILFFYMIIWKNHVFV